LSKDQRYLAAASHAISIVDLEKGIPSIIPLESNFQLLGMNIRQLVGHDNWITGICEHRFNSYIWATVSADLTVRTWDIRMHPGQASCRRAQKRFNCLQFSPDCGFLACGGDNISVFDLQEAQNISQMNTPSKVLLVFCCCKKFFV
jgi:WD40 repeat protein